MRNLKRLAVVLACCLAMALCGCDSSGSEDTAGLIESEGSVAVVLDRPDGASIASLFDMPASFNEETLSDVTQVSVSSIGSIGATVVRFAQTSDGGWVAWTDDYCYYTPNDLSSNEMTAKAGVLPKEEVETFDLSNRDVLEDKGIELSDAWF